ncbi:hypothetical protein GCM10022419_052820 [Nonomuraea rosea]|uniref:Alpha/beta hydrolase n=1 Tax=Nonomuraea rosea TaxID=638574 RepID=A0ABP6XDN2_9ACTN
MRDTAIRDSLSASAEARHEWPLHGIAQDITRAARDIEIPVTVPAGENDVVEPPRVLRDHLLPHTPHATLTTVPYVGHLLPAEAPGAVAAALEDFRTAVQR